jgi:hypothetical protein
MENGVEKQIPVYMCARTGCGKEIKCARGLTNCFTHMAGCFGGEESLRAVHSNFLLSQVPLLAARQVASLDENANTFANSVEASYITDYNRGM